MNTIIPETMQGFMECFGEDCLNMMRELAAQGDTDAQDVQGETLREAIDNAMDAARAAGGE